MSYFLLAQGGASQGSFLGGLLPILLIVAIFYWLVYRPQQQRRKNLQTMIENLKNGDKVITNGGLYATVTGIRENTVLLKVADQVKIEVAKNAVASLQSAPLTSQK